MHLMTFKPMAHASTFSLSLILSLSLVACGGGGDSTAVSPASYQPGQAELGAWNVLQGARTLCKFGALTRNTQLDAAALSHAKYLVDLSIATGISTLSHLETPGVPGFTGIYPWDRAVYQGYNYLALAEILEATVWDYTYAPAFPTMEERGASSIHNLLNTVYHLSGAMYDGSEVGLGAYLATTKISATTWREEYRFGSLNAYQYDNQRVSLGTGNVATYPCQGSSNVPTSFEPANESPNPFVGTPYASAVVGPPIYLKVDAGQVLHITSSNVSQNGISVPTTVLTNANDPNRDLYNNPYIETNEAFVVPISALLPNIIYQVSLTGTINNVPFTRSFTMSTGL